jgi:hypothetical protein
MFLIVFSSCCAIIGVSWVLLFFATCLSFLPLCVGICRGLKQVMIGLLFLLPMLGFVSSLPVWCVSCTSGLCAEGLVRLWKMGCQCYLLLLGESYVFVVDVLFATESVFSSFSSRFRYFL